MTMQPDRSNYEIWIADWLAGTLDKGQIKLLEEFFDLNPDLKEEAESLLFTIVEPDKKYFPRKDLLKRTAEDLTSSQIEYLSVAYLENDISPEQAEELNECLAKNPGLRSLSGSVRKMKLTPPEFKYSFKERLKKKTTTGKILRFSYLGLSAAASISILVLSSVFISRLITEKSNKPAVTETIHTDPVILYTKVLHEREGNPVVESSLNKINGKTPQINTKALMTDEQIMNERTDNEIPDFNRLPLAELADMKISDLPDFSIEIIQEPVLNTLLAISIPVHEAVYDDRNGLSRFLARTFRDKILREDTGSDAPVRPYEIASAGINGISRLFGLDMSLVSITDSHGDLKSLYFSSRLVKFNAPVKKGGSMQ